MSLKSSENLQKLGGCGEMEIITCSSVAPAFTDTCASPHVSFMLAAEGDGGLFWFKHGSGRAALPAGGLSGLTGASPDGLNYRRKQGIGQNCKT